MKNTNESKRPAFPCVDLEYHGLTKREYIATAIMQGIILDPNGGNTSHIAKAAIKCADVLLKELAAPPAS